MNLNEYDERSSYTDLDWTAFCYIADELGPQERDEFELRLKDDPLACQAVAEAMHQAQLVYAGFSAPSSVPATPVNSVARGAGLTDNRWRPTRALAWYATIAALLLVAIGGYAFLPGSGAPSGSELANQQSQSASSGISANSDALAQDSSSQTESVITAWIDSIENFIDFGAPETLDDRSGYTRVLFNESDRDWIWAAAKELDDDGEPEPESTDEDSPKEFDSLDFDDVNDAPVDGGMC